MGKPIDAPITGAVLSWAIDESGLNREDVAAKVKTDLATLNKWETEREPPSLTQLRRISRVLKRPLAAFFLPERPRVEEKTIEFRAASGSGRSEPNPVERKAFRDARRLQTVLSWLGSELAFTTQLPLAQVGEGPEIVGSRIREWIGVEVRTQEAWGSAAKAFRAWRSALEERQIYVLALSLGANSVRGFSLWDDCAPIISVNTRWNHQARVFTLFHELAHLLTHSSSACLGYASLGAQVGSETTERWCERVAAAALLPQHRFLAVANDVYVPNANAGVHAQLESVREIATVFSVSLRATCLRLIELNLAPWNLFEAVPTTVDQKEPGFGKGGRVREQMKEDQLGRRTKETLRLGVRAELITRADALTYFDVASEQFGDEPSFA